MEIIFNIGSILSCEFRLSAIYCNTHNIYGIRFLRFNENDILAYFNFGSHDIPDSKENVCNVFLIFY